MRILSKKGSEAQKAKLEQLYTLYEQQMYGIAYSILHQTEQAEDAVQDAFIKVISYLPKIAKADSSRTRGLMLRIIRTTAIDQYRRNSRDSVFLTVEEEATECNVIPFDMSQQAADRDLLSRLLFELDTIYLEIIKLRCYFGFTNREAAKILNITEDAAAKRLERAKKLIQKRMGDEEYETGTGIGTITEKSGRRSHSGASTI